MEHLGKQKHFLNEYITRVYFCKFHYEIYRNELKETLGNVTSHFFELSNAFLELKM